MRSCGGGRSNSPFCETNCHACALPKQTVTCSLSACYYQTHTPKNKTMWLILNDCLPDHAAGSVSSRVERPAWAPFLSPAEWASTLCCCWCLFVHHFHLLSSYRTRWMIRPLVRSQEENWQNRPLAGAAGLMPVSEVGGNTRVHIWHDLFESTEWKGHFTGIFLGPFQWDKGSVSVKLPAVAPAVSLMEAGNITYNVVS